MDPGTRLATNRTESSVPARVGRQWWPDPSARVPRVVRIAANLVGAAGAGYFSYVTLEAYLRTHRPIGFLFFAEQMVVVVAYLARRPAHTVTARLGDWLLAFGGTFLPVLLRPDGAHAPWGLQWGLVLQFCGVVVCLWSFLALGRSFGFAAADRGLVQRGPYRIVRHPIYASYVLLQTGYLLQSFSLRNLAVVLLAIACNVGRIRAEEHVLGTNPAHAAYSRRVRWKVFPGLW
jgi:protein-S-isoprenylcysteine O-methyltransferase Ste14